MKATELLMNEHRQILRALHVVEQMGEKAVRGGEIVEADVTDILEFLDLFADKYHQGREEAVLFPAMMRCNPADCAKLRHMTFEHDQERSLIQGLQEAVKTHKTKDFAYYAERLVHILRTHIYKEDHILFEIADAGFSAEEDERVAKELAEFDRGRQQDVEPRLLARLRELEWKYLDKCEPLAEQAEDLETPTGRFR